MTFMSRRISSSSTWWYKRALPFVWFSIWALMFASVLLAAMRGRAPAPVLLIPVGAMAFGYFLSRALLWLLADEVWWDGDELVVRNGGDEEWIAIDDVVNVEGTPFVNPEQIRLTLREPSRFGREIVFMPPVRFLAFGRHPLVRELMQRVHRLDAEEA
jgi:hypothetical protein